MRKLLLLPLILSVQAAFGQYSGTPLLLSLPMNQDTIEEDEPVFVWQTTLSNLQNDPRLNVQLSVVQMDQNQTQTEAMIENPPVFIRQNLLSNSLNYSSIDHELEDGIWYAWQVVLFYNGVQVQQSEVWKFIKAEVAQPVLPFTVLKKQTDNSLYDIEGDLLYLCTTERGEFQLTGEISGKKMESQVVNFVEINSVGEPISPGTLPLETRYYTCDLSELDIKNGTTYRIVWAASGNVKFILYLTR